MRNRLIALSLLVVLTACSRDTQQPSPPAPTYSVTQFASLRWLEGQWNGSGGNYPSFFEEYRVIDDSTIAMRAFKDSTFKAVSDSSLIQIRGGVVSNGASNAAMLNDSSVKFMRPGATGGGYTWTRNAVDQWTATLHPASAGGVPTVYTLKRIKR